MKTILQSQLNITNLHAFLKLFQLRTRKSLQTTQKHLLTAFLGCSWYLERFIVSLIDNRW